MAFYSPCRAPFLGHLSVRALSLSAIVMASFSGSAVAQVLTVDGNQLLSWCNTNINREAVGDFAIKGGGCLGYLTSIVNIQMSGAAVAGRRACVPPNADMNSDRRHLQGLYARSSGEEAPAGGKPCCTGVFRSFPVPSLSA